MFHKLNPISTESPADYSVALATTDFTNWMNITTNSPLDTFLEFMDLDATNYPFRFYRWRRDP